MVRRAPPVAFNADSGTLQVRSSVSITFAKRRRPCRWRRCPWIVSPLWVNRTADPIERGRGSLCLAIRTSPEFGRRKNLGAFLVKAGRVARRRDEGSDAEPDNVTVSWTNKHVN